MTDGLGTPPTINPPFSHKLKIWAKEYGWIALLLTILSSYVLFVWHVNQMIVARVEKEAELEGKIEKLTGKMEILLEDRKYLLDKLQETAQPVSKE